MFNVAGKVEPYVGTWQAEFEEVQKILQGPKGLRGISALSGLALTVGCVLSCWNIIFHLTTAPAESLIKIYVALAGLIIFANEGVASTERVDAIRNFSLKWFPFLNAVPGKGFFMIFVGLIGFAYHSEMLLYMPAAAVGGCGAANLALYYSKKSKVDAAIEKSMALNKSLYTPIPKTYSPPPQKDHNMPYDKAADAQNDQYRFV